MYITFALLQQTDVASTSGLGSFAGWGATLPTGELKTAGTKTEGTSDTNDFKTGGISFNDDRVVPSFAIGSTIGGTFNYFGGGGISSAKSTATSSPFAATTTTSPFGSASPPTSFLFGNRPVDAPTTSGGFGFAQQPGFGGGGLFGQLGGGGGGGGGGLFGERQLPTAGGGGGGLFGQQQTPPAGGSGGGLFGQPLPAADAGALPGS